MNLLQVKKLVVKESNKKEQRITEISPIAIKRRVNKRNIKQKNNITKRSYYGC